MFAFIIELKIYNSIKLRGFVITSLNVTVLIINVGRLSSSWKYYGIVGPWGFNSLTVLYYLDLKVLEIVVKFKSCTYIVIFLKMCTCS